MEVIHWLQDLWLRLNPDMDPKSGLHVVKADAGTVAVLVIEVALAVLSAYLAGRLADKKNNHGKDDKPTNLAERGTMANWFLGLRRLGLVFCWAGNRHIRKESAPGGKGSLFGGGAKIPIYYESGVHVVGAPWADELRVIQQNGKIMFKGPISRHSHPSGTQIDLGKEGSFTVWWGGQDYIVPIENIGTDSVMNGFIGIDSRFPLFTRIDWIQKRLGSGPNWPMMDYTMFRYCRYADDLLPSVPSYVPPTFTLDGQVIPIVDHVNGVEGVGHFVTTADIGTVTTEEGVHYRTSAIKDNDQLELSGNAMADGTYVVLYVAPTTAIDPVTFLTIPASKVYLKGGLSGANDSGSLQLYSRADDDGLNPAHCIAELMFAPWPFGIGLDSAPYNITGGGNSLDELAVLCDSEGLKASLLGKDDTSAQQLLAGILQDVGCLLTLNTATGLYDFVPVRATDPLTWKEVTSDMLAGNLPEIETLTGELPKSEMVYAFADRANNFRDMTIQVAGDGQAAYADRHSTDKTDMPSVIDFDVAATVSERRSQETLAGGAVFRFTAARGVRELIPGMVITIEDISEPVRVISVEINGESAEVKVEAISDFMGAKESEVAHIATGAPAGGAGTGSIAPPLQFDLFQVPNTLTGGIDTVIVPQIRASDAVADTTANISPDDTTYYEKDTSTNGQAGGVTTSSMLVGDTTGPTFDGLGPDLDTIQDLTADAASYGAGRQLLMIVSGAGTEIMFLESVTALGGGSYQANNITRGQFGTSALAHGSGARAYIFNQDDVLALQDVLIASGNTIYVKMVPGGVSASEVGEKHITIV